MSLCIANVIMGARRIFFGVGKLGGLETKVPQPSPGVESRWGGAEGSPQKPTKYCENNA